MENLSLDHVAHDLALRQLSKIGDVDNELLVKSYCKKYNEIRKLLELKPKEPTLNKD